MSKPAASESRKLAQEVAGLIAFKPLVTSNNPGSHTLRLNGGGRIQCESLDAARELARRVSDEINAVMSSRSADALKRASAALERLTIRSADADIRQLTDAIEEAHIITTVWALAGQGQSFDNRSTFYVSPSTDGVTVYGTVAVVTDLANAIEARLIAITEPLLSAAKKRLEQALLQVAQ